jgi:D-alanyl-D-alanine-carboxypeptidase/D-alanyl-D-alanine-endopeptidase
MRKTAAFALLMLILVGHACAQPLSRVKESKLKKRGARLIKESEAVGLSVGIISRGQSYYFNFGTINPDFNVAPTSQSVYQIGSVTKTFVSLLFAQAVIEEKISLDDDIRKYLDDSYPNLEYKGHPITLLHLANYTSGLPDNLLPASATEDSSAFQTEQRMSTFTKKDLIQALKTVTLDTIPGYHPHHSNTASQLLRYIIEKIYASPIEKSVREFILDPLKMNDTSFGTEMSDHNLLTGYNDKGKAMPWFTNSFHSGTGGIRSSAADFTKYMFYLLRSPDAQTKLALRKTILVDAGTNKVIGFNPPDKIDPTKYSVSLNWYHYAPELGNSRIFADGGTPGFACYVAMYPESDLGIVLLANKLSEKVFNGLSSFADEIYKICMDKK